MDIWKSKGYPINAVDAAILLSEAEHRISKVNTWAIDNNKISLAAALDNALYDIKVLKEKVGRLVEEE